MSTILIVDDTAAVRKSLSALLKRAGHRVCLAGDALEAMIVARRELPQLVVSDVVMPGEDGFELARQLRADPATGNAKVILYTSMYSEAEARTLTRGCGALKLINKSETPAVLLRAIEDTLSAPSSDASSEVPSADYDREHRRLVEDKLLQTAEALEVTKARLHSLVDAGQEITLAKDVRRLLERFCADAESILGCAHVVSGISERRCKRRRTFISGLGGHRVVCTRQVPGVVQGVMEDRRPVQIGSCADALSVVARAVGIPTKWHPLKTVLVVPVPAASMSGWVCFVNKNGETGRFDEEEERVAVMLGAQLALAIDNLHHARVVREYARKREQSARKRTIGARRSDRALEHFTATAAHDLQAPLHTLGGYLERLANLPGACVDSESRQSLEAATASADRMRQLIHDMLAYSRLDASHGQFKHFNGADALTAALENLSADMVKAGAVVTWDPFPMVYADETQLTQVFQNLIHNAVKYRRADEPQVHVSVERKRGQWQVSVRDNGIGVRREDATRIFKLFERLHGQDRYPGSGIGLAICKKIIERHGGRIRVESDPGQGSTFHFTLADQTTLRPGPPSLGA